MSLHRSQFGPSRFAAQSIQCPPCPVKLYNALSKKHFCEYPLQLQAVNLFGRDTLFRLDCKSVEVRSSKPIKNHNLANVLPILVNHMAKWKVNSLSHHVSFSSCSITYYVSPFLFPCHTLSHVSSDHFVRLLRIAQNRHKKKPNNMFKPVWQINNQFSTNGFVNLQCYLWFSAYCVARNCTKKVL